jgi:histidine triad (HIT) family protein
MNAPKPDCLFCDIVAEKVKAEIVFADEHTLAFLDHRPLFPGHCLLITKQHVETLLDLPNDLIAPLFSNAKLVAGAVERACAAEGSFVAINNKISQSVPHLHIHIVPRRKGDGLKGFFWPRHKYSSEGAMKAAADSIRRQIEELRAVPF